MSCYSTFRPTFFALGLSIPALLIMPTPTHAQGDLIGQRGGRLASMPASGMFNGLNLGGQSIQNGLGSIVSVLTQNGVHGQQLSSIIHDLQASRRFGDRDGNRFGDRDDRRFGDRDDRRFGDRDDQRFGEHRDGNRALDRDIREDRRDLLNDERRLQADQNRLARDREDLARDLRERQTRPSGANLAGSTTQPTLPSNLNLPPGVQSSLLKGLDSSGTATRHGMGWIVSDAAHQGVHGQQLSDMIHQLKPYKERGVLTFPQNGATQNGSQQIFQQPQRGFEGGRGNFGGGKGHGKGKGR